MPLQPSILKDNDIESVLNYYYNVSVTSVEKIPGGTANCYKITANKQPFFLKEFQQSYDTSRAEREAALLSFLGRHGFPAPQIVPTVMGYSHIVYRERVLQLQKYIDGVTPRENSLEPDAMMQAAGLLGSLNALLQSYDMTVAMGDKWLGMYDQQEYDRFYAETSALLELSVAAPIYLEKIKDDIEFRRELNRSMPQLSKSYCGITYTPSHGDFIYSQLICDKKGSIKKIVDFSSAHTVPISLELMRFYMLSSADCKTPGRFDMHLFKQYIANYMQFFPLSLNDLKNMPIIYLYYMARNKYVYREFLQSNGEKETSFLQSSWRTDVCRFLYENAQKISEELVSLLD